LSIRVDEQNVAQSKRREQLLAKLDEVLAELRDIEVGGGCGGACTGQGKASHFVPAKDCPTPCDQNEYKAYTIETAKERAKYNATMNCREFGRGDYGCNCEDGTFKEVSRMCIPVTIEGVQYCEYELTYQYDGTCKQTGPRTI